MLILKRKEGQWVKLTHSSGDVIRIGVRDIHPQYPGQLRLVFDDAARNFEIKREEQKTANPASTGSASTLENLVA